jgi:RecA-family ATPase
MTGAKSRDFADVGNDMGDSVIALAVKRAAPVASNPDAITATPYSWRDPSSIPLRPWVYGRWFLRGNIACVVAPGGVGKTTMLSGTALAMVTGRPLLGKSVWEGPKRVWLWNLEDDLDELSRSIQASAKHYGVKPEEIDGRLFVDSAMEGNSRGAL